MQKNTRDINGLGYIIREEHVQAAVDKATSAERLLLEGLLKLVSELDDLDRTLPERVHEAQLKPVLHALNSPNRRGKRCPSRKMHTAISIGC